MQRDKMGRFLYQLFEPISDTSKTFSQKIRTHFTFDLHSCSLAIASSHRKKRECTKISDLRELKQIPKRQNLNIRSYELEDMMEEINQAKPDLLSRWAK